MADDQTLPTQAAWDFNQSIIRAYRARKFPTAKTFLICAGPPTYSNTTLENVTPLGLIQQVGKAEQRQILRLFEVGSREPYLVSGRDNNRLTLNQIMYHGRSLMHALYLNNG